MCGRFAQQTEVQQLAMQFDVREALPNTRRSWNVAPRASAPVVRLHPETRQRHLDLLQWGLVPRWAQDPKSLKPQINARAETVASSRMFSDAFRKRRCLVPADAYYEWQVTEAGKQPWAIGRVDGAPLAFAGIWEGWRSPEDGQILRTFAIITCDATPELRPIHDRMPVVLERETWPAWLGEVDGGDVSLLLQPAEPGILHAWRVGRAVGRVGNDGPDLLAPV